MARTSAVIPVESIAGRIYLIRGEKVMLDSDLAELYGVETRALVQAVRRNADRFPGDFMFRFSKEELENWRSQIVMSNPAAKMGLRRQPYAFTELGIAMLSTVLRSERAVQINIAIMRTFVRLREILATHKDLARKVAEHDRQIAALVFTPASLRSHRLLAAPSRTCWCRRIRRKKIPLAMSIRKIERIVAGGTSNAGGLNPLNRSRRVRMRAGVRKC